MQSPAHFLRQYFEATNWSSDNHYANLTIQSRNLLDFPIPPGFHLSLSHRPTPSFLSALSLSSLVPTTIKAYPPRPAPIILPVLGEVLGGQLSYAFSTVELNRDSSRRSAIGVDRLKVEEVGQSFKVGIASGRPELREDCKETWQGGKRIDKSDFLLYGRIYAPASRLDGLYVHRWTPTLQTIISLVSVPSPPTVAPLAWPEENGASNISNSSGTAARLSELEFKLQQDTGKYSTEYSYAVGDGMYGMRGLYNFGKSSDGGGLSQEEEERRLETDEIMQTGLKGRWSAGGEVFFSAQERSAGVSTGVRFCTVPESITNMPGVMGTSQPPTVISATLNPIMGHLSTAYSVGVSPNSTLASRFDFNLFSYDADLTIGGEWLQRRSPRKKLIEDDFVQPDWGSTEEPTTASWDAFGRGQQEFMDAKKVEISKEQENEVIGAIKFRASTNTDLALLWEGRLGDFLVSAGVVADVKVMEVKSVGFGIQYWG